jgi:hypothetical protein
MLIRETALLYALVMAALAWRDGERREALGWGAALLLFTVALTAHAYAVNQVTGPLDPASPGWTGLNGLGFFVRAITLGTALQLAPPALAQRCWSPSSFSAGPAGATARAARVRDLRGYALTISLFARSDTFYWGLMIAPAFLVGLAFAPDALRDLWVAALDRRECACRGRAMRRILLVVGGGIAAYKACELIRQCRKAGIEVRCVLTAGGAQFVTPMTLAALSEQPGHTSSGTSRTRPRWGISG